MPRLCLTAILTAFAVALIAPHGAEARTPCAGELVTPAAANAAQVNDAVFCLSNQLRAHYGLPAFTRDTRLDTAARLHSADMGVRNFFDHVNPDGLTPTARAAAQGYTLGVGENIAYGYANARAVVIGWLGSAGHCRNLLGSARNLGVGTVVSDVAYYTQMFGDYFTTAIDATPRDSCPHSVDLDTLRDAAAVVPAPAATPLAAYSESQDYAETAAPSLGALSFSPRRFRVRRGATTISYHLSTAATVTFRVQRESGRSGHFTTVSGRFSDVGAAGDNSLRFGGRIADKPLRTGRYRLQAVAKDVLGRSTPLVRIRFSVVR